MLKKKKALWHISKIEEWNHVTNVTKFCVNQVIYLTNGKILNLSLDMCGLWCLKYRLSKMFNSSIYYLIGITLIDQKPLTFSRKGHFRWILTDKCVKISVEFFRQGAFFGAQNSAQSLRFLPSRPTMTRNLNQNIGFWQIKGSIGDFRDKNCTDFWIILEILNNLNSFRLRSRAINKRFSESCCVMFQSKNVVWKNDDFVVAFLVIFD